MALGQKSKYRQTCRKSQSHHLGQQRANLIPETAQVGKVIVISIWNGNAIGQSFEIGSESIF